MLEAISTMKQYQQIHLLCYDKGFKFVPIPNVKSFNSLTETEEFVEHNLKRLNDTNFYKDPIVIIRKEINSVKVKEL